VVRLVAFRVLATVELPAADISGVVDAVTGGLPREYDTTVPFPLYIPQTTTTTQLTGSVIHTQG